LPLLLLLLLMVVLVVVPQRQQARLDGRLGARRHERRGSGRIGRVYFRQRDDRGTAAAMQLW
jgi:hypothetical protein